jgi:hypothetical protein
VSLPGFSNLRLFRCQSFERLRWRDLYHWRPMLLALPGAAIAGIAADVAGTRPFTQPAQAVGKIQTFMKWYDVIAGPFISLPDSGNLQARHPGIMVASAAFLLLWSALEFKAVKRFCATHILPDPPQFLDIKLEKETNDEVQWYYPHKPFVGRKEELEILDAFADAPTSFLIWGLYGASGLGKSHLAANWLKSLYARGWDIGFLKDDATASGSNLTLGARV